MLTQGRLARPLMDGFAANGCEVEQVTDHSSSLAGFDFLIMYGPMTSIGTQVERLKSLPSPPPVIFWYTEQMPDPSLPAWLVQLLARLRYANSKWYDGLLTPRISQMSGNRLHLPEVGRLRAVGEIIELHKAGRLKIVCALSETNRRFLSRFDLPVVEIPIGYHPFFGEQLGLRRDIDVVFLGTQRDRRRRKWIARLAKELGEMRLQFIVKDGSPQRGYLFDLQRTLLLNRTKIMLNVMRQPWDDAIHRFLLAAANGALLLSEPIHEESTGPLQAGVHFVECRLEEMAHKAKEYLEAPAKREGITENAGNLVRSELTMTRMAGLCLQRMVAL